MSGRANPFLAWMLQTSINLHENIMRFLTGTALFVYRKNFYGAHHRL